MLDTWEGVPGLWELAALDVAAESMQRITARRSGGVFDGDLELVEKTFACDLCRCSTDPYSHEILQPVSCQFNVLAQELEAGWKKQ